MAQNVDAEKLKFLKLYAHGDELGQTRSGSPHNALHSSKTSTPERVTEETPAMVDNGACAS